MVSVRTLLFALVAVSALSAVLAAKPPAPAVVSAADNLVLRINAHIFNNAPKPPASTPMSRVNSLSFIAMHDAINSINDIYQPVYPIAKLRGAEKKANVRAAYLSAFNTTRLIGMQRLPNNYKANILLFTAADIQPYVTALETFVATELAAIRTQDTAANVEAGLAVGKRAAERIMELRENDGYKVPAPIQDAECGVQGQWCSWTTKHLPADARGAGYPNWGNVQPFSHDEAAVFTVPPPPKAGSSIFEGSLNNTYLFGAKGSQVTSADWAKEAHIWSLGAGGELGARFVSDVFYTGNIAQTEFDTVALFGRLYVGNCDALINNLYNKYKYNSWRPYQAIRQEHDAAWLPALNTPVNQEYPCGHCEGTAGALTAVSLFLGYDEFPFEAVPFKVPGQQIQPSFRAFSEIIEHVNRARVYGGMHFPFSVAMGSRYGTQISTHVHQTMFLKK